LSRPTFLPYTTLFRSLNADAIVQYAKEQAILLRKAFAEERFPLVLGGDCSIMIGNALALKQEGNYALFYLDGHTDFMEPEFSQTDRKSTRLNSSHVKI